MIQCPKIDSDPKNYRLSLIEALNTINVAWEQEDYRKYIEDAVQCDSKWTKYTKAVKSAPYFDIRSLSALIFLKNHGQPLNEQDMASIDARLEKVQRDFEEREHWRQVEIDAMNAQPKPEQDDIEFMKEMVKRQALGNSIGEVDYTIDEVIDGKVLDENERQALAKKVYNVASESGVKKEAIAGLKALYKQYNDLYVKRLDSETKEAYGVVAKKYMLKRILAVIQDCLNVFIALKNVKSHKAKTKTPEQMARKMHTAKRYDQFNVIGCAAKDLIGSTVAYVYNMSRQKVVKYIAVKGMSLSVKGTSIVNFDPIASEAKKVKNEAEFFSMIRPEGKLSKRELNRWYNSKRQASRRITGRVSNTCLILSVS